MLNPTVEQVIERLESFAPPAYAEPHDPVGLQLGDRQQPVKKIMVTLDVRPEVVAEAIANQVDLIIAHHPMMFHPARNLDFQNPQNKMYADLIQHSIAVFAAHTNLDEIPAGMNHWLAQALGLTHCQPFNRQEKADPTINAYLGVVGQLPQPQTVRDFAEFCKQQFKLSGLRLVTHEPQQLIQKVALIGGDGGKFYPAAIAAGADVFVTGDVYYHTAHDMLAHGLSVVDPGHHVEAIIKQQLPPLLRQWAQQADWSVTIISSQLSTDPFQFI